MRQLLLTLRYRGTNYHGFQVQKNARTVASTVQDAVERVFGARLDVKGCSRTDAGVHANCFALTLRTGSLIPCDALVRAMNVNLPEDIAVTACREVADDFHPRYCSGNTRSMKSGCTWRRRDFAGRTISQRSAVPGQA